LSIFLLHLTHGHVLMPSSESCLLLGYLTEKEIRRVVDDKLLGHRKLPLVYNFGPLVLIILLYLFLINI